MSQVDLKKKVCSRWSAPYNEILGTDGNRLRWILGTDFHEQQLPSVEVELKLVTESIEIRHFRAYRESVPVCSRLFRNRDVDQFPSPVGTGTEHDPKISDHECALGTEFKIQRGGGGTLPHGQPSPARYGLKVFKKVVAKQSTPWYDRRTRSGKGAQTEGWAFYG